MAPGVCRCSRGFIGATCARGRESDTSTTYLGITVSAFYISSISSVILQRSAGRGVSMVGVVLRLGDVVALGPTMVRDVNVVSFTAFQLYSRDISFTRHVIKQNTLFAFPTILLYTSVELRGARTYDTYLLLVY